jgi:hypothetical protein
MISFSKWRNMMEQAPNMQPNMPQNPVQNQQPNQQPSNKFSAESKAKRDALKQLVNVVVWPAGLQGADTNKKLEKNRSKALNLFADYLKFFRNPHPKSGNMRAFDFLTKIIDPANFNMLLDPATFVNAINITYDAINLYNQFIAGLEPNSELYPTAMQNKEKMEKAYKQLLSLNK